MKIGIIGGGFFGVFIACALKNKFNQSVSIDIFDREKNLLTQAANNNQCRLHMGFHYPRSPETIKQTIEGFTLFYNEFSDCVYFPKKNYYAVRKDGNVNFSQYISAMDEFDLEYEVCEKKQIPYLKNMDLIEGIINTGEGVINLPKLRRNLLNKLDANICCNSNVTAVDSNDGVIIANDRINGPYDFIINTTYIDPNLGLTKDKLYEVKFELAAMVLINAPFGEDVALTVMDGEYVSLYPCGYGLATLSSVTHTPFLHYDTIMDLVSKLPEARKIAEKNNVTSSILDHAKEIINFDNQNLDVRGLWISPKCKIKDDIGNTRISDIRSFERVISVLCGKLDSVHSITNRVLEFIR